MSKRITTSQISELLAQDKAGTVTRALLQAFLENPGHWTSDNGGVTPQPDADGWYAIEVDGDAYQGPFNLEQYSYFDPEATAEGFPVQPGRRTIRYKFLEFDHPPITQQVMDRANEEGYRLPDRAETETVQDCYAAEYADSPIVGICGRPSGGVVAYVIQHSRSRDLYLSRMQYRWNRDCRFLVVAHE